MAGKGSTISEEPSLILRKWTMKFLFPHPSRELDSGKFYEVRITGAEEFDLYGEVLNDWLLFRFFRIIDQ